MKQGGETASTQGFTIVETLIVLAVTGTLFVSAALLINGKQNKTDFQVGSQQIQQQLQQIINETVSGYYANSNNFTCSASGSGPNVTFSPVGNTQGSNMECIFAGKTVVFNPDTALNANRSYSIYSLAGRRSTSPSGPDVKNPVEAWISAVPYSDNIVTKKYPNGLTYYDGRVKGAPSWVTGSRFVVAFMSSFANFQGSGTGKGGSQQIELRGYTNPWLDTDNVVNINDEEGSVDPYGTVSGVLPGVDLCFNSGGTQQSVIVSISGGLAISTQIMTGNCPS